MTLKKEIDHYLKKLFPITRSIAGNGNRETLKILRDLIPLQIHEFPTGLQVYDWTVPKEWNIQDAWIKNSQGQKVIDFKRNNLHVVSYSTPIHQKMKFKELTEHLHYLQHLLEAIPYKTSYYHDYWGFCISYQDFQNYFHEDEEYEVFIDSTLKNGSLTLADLVIPGKSEKEYLISTYFCHPSLANDNLSGVVLTAFLARELLKMNLNYSYRILFVPETIGALTYCFSHEQIIKKCEAGFVITCVAGPSDYSYKKTFLETHMIDRVVCQTFEEKNIPLIQYPFSPQGSDERQFSSPGFRIPMGSIHKDKYYEYPYYHNSLDNLDFISAENLKQTLDLYLSVITRIENNMLITSLNPYGEPCLGKRGLYPKIGRTKSNVWQNTSIQNHRYQWVDELDAIYWILFLADGQHHLLDIAEKTGISFEQLIQVSQKLRENHLIK